MTPVTIPTRPRLSPDVRSLRVRSSYTNYSPPKLHLNDPKPTQDASEPTTDWSGPKGYGARHRLDDAPFSLWNSEVCDFRHPTQEEIEWISKRFNSTSLEINWPNITIETATPPSDLPLTVACVGVSFIPSPAKTSCLPAVSDIRPLDFPTDYGGIRNNPPDPLTFKFRKWTQPTDAELQQFVTALCTVCQPFRVYFLCPDIVIELRTDDGVVYKTGSLPQLFGGFAAHYHHGTDPFKTKVAMAQARLITPTGYVKDDTDYLQAHGGICPGVCVSSGTVNNIGQYVNLSMSTTAGVLLRNNHGEQRITVSNHGFLYSNEVYHPSASGTSIGTIKERWPALDIALVDLNPSIHFSNGSYFESDVPTRLLHHSQVIPGEFYAVDGMSCGQLWFQMQGERLEIPRRPEGITAIDFKRMKLYRSFGNTGIEMRDGVCGAAIVREDGGVAGFFWEASDHYAFFPSLNELIDRGWSVV